ncbi:hypothetical protein [Pseudomonas sp. DG56-2]|nr:hypothetical protein [Pseudomonas sp. DG56-2]
MSEFHIGIVPACEPPTAIDSHVAVWLSEAAFAVLAAGPALVIGDGVGEA